jgi:hypothetical protein
MNKKELIYAGILVVVSTLASMLIWGYHFGIKNNEFHSIIVNKIAQGISYKGDALAASMHNFVSPFWVVAGLLSKVFPEQAVFFTFFFLSRVLLCIGLASMIHAFSESRFFLHSVLLGSLIMISSGSVNVLPLGDNVVISDYLSQTFLSVGFCLVSFSLSVRKKYVWSAIILGIAYNINAMQANFVLGILLVMWLVKAREEKISYASLGLPIGLFLLCASPTIYWIAAALHEKPAGNYMAGSALADFAKYYLPSHYFWTVKALRDKLNGISIITTVLTLAVSGVVIKDTVFARFKKKEVLISALVSLVYVIVGAISVEIFPSRLFFQLHLFRSDVIIYLISLAYLLSLLLMKDLQPYTRLMLVAAIAEYVTNAFFKAQLFILWAVFIEGARYYRVKESFIKAANLFFVVALGILFIRTGYREMMLLVPFFVFYLLSRMDRKSPTGVPLDSGRKEQAIAAQHNRLLGFARRNLLVIGYICACMFITFSSYIARTNDYAEKERAQQEIRALADNISRKVPANALFLIPPWYEIRPQLKHGVFVSMKDGAAYLWDKGYEFEYIRRLNVLGIPYTPGIPFDESKVKQYFFNNIVNSLASAGKEGVTHVILPKTMFPPSSNAYDGHSIGESENLIVLDLDSALHLVKKSSRLTLTYSRQKINNGS